MTPKIASPTLSLILTACLLAAIAACAPIAAPSAGIDSPQAPQRLSPAEIYRRVSPSVAYVETVTGSGSGLLVELRGKKYLVTNAHVVWPYTKARLVFPNREEHLDVPVLQTDQLVDLAILGPLATAIPALPFSSQREFTTGSPVYLVGYPGEGELFPDPAISQGILSRTRIWHALDSLHYYQTDAAGAGGQSGGILVSDAGEVIGFSGLLFADAFVLAASSTDLASRLQTMSENAGAETAQHRVPERESRKSYRSQLQNLWDTQGFLIQAPYDSKLTVEAVSDGDLGLALFDSYADELEAADQTFTGTETVSTTVSTKGPLFLLVEQYLTGAAEFTLRSSHRLTPMTDNDDSSQVDLGENMIALGASSTVGTIDYPGDIDWFPLYLVRGQQIEATVESVAIDPVLAIGPQGASADAYLEDDDSGRGMLGTNAHLRYRARRSGEYLVVVRSYAYEDLGGYLLTVRDAK